MGVFMLSPRDNVGEDMMFSGCPSTAFVRSSVRWSTWSGQILLPLYLMNGLSILDEIYRE